MTRPPQACAPDLLALVVQIGPFWLSHGSFGPF
jgi:hypothetical protein